MLFSEETGLRLEGLCSGLPLVVLQEAERATLLRQHATKRATTPWNNTTKFLESRSYATRYYNTSRTGQKEYNAAPAKISAFHCSKIVADLRDPGSHWSWDVKRVPRIQSSPLEKSNVTLGNFFEKYTCTVSPCKPGGWTMLVLYMEPHRVNYWVTFGLWIKMISVLVLFFLLPHKY